jgi:hypothetical protein
MEKPSGASICSSGFSLPPAPPGNSAFRKALFLVLSLLSTVLGAEGLESMDYRFVGERPNATRAATIVSFNLYVIDIDAIDDVTQRFSVDMFVNIAWSDPRLALPEGEQSGLKRTLPLNEIWTPRGLIVNDRGLSPQLPLIADVDDQGNVQHRQRFSGELAVDLDLREFPFDIQHLPIDIISYQYSPDDVVFLSNAGISRDEREFSAEGWRFKMLDAEIGEFTIPAAGIVRPRLTYVIEAQRNVRYYLLTMFLPVSLIIFMSWTAFWLHPNLLPSRIAISTASIFSLIAFGFSIRLSLPPVSYLTRADIFWTGCMLLVFLALGVATIGSRWASEDQMARALRLNAVARWVYIALFGLFAAIAITM